MKIAILTDSAYESQKTYHNLYKIPLSIILPNLTNIKDDDEFSDHHFLSLMNTYSLKTSQTPLGEIINIFTNLLNEYDQIIVCGIAKNLSGQYNAYLLAANKPQFKNKIFIIDSNGVSIILEHQIIEIQKLIELNKTGLEIKTAITKNIQNYDCYILSKSWDNFIRSGRISKIKGKISKSLKFNLVLHVKNKKIVFDSMHRGFLSSVKYILDNLQLHEIKCIDIGYGIIEEEVILKIKQIVAQYGFKINLYSKLPKSIMVNTGLYSIAFSIWKKDK